MVTAYSSDTVHPISSVLHRFSNYALLTYSLIVHGPSRSGEYIGLKFCRIGFEVLLAAARDTGG
jgi:hypothetical protein